MQAEEQELIKCSGCKKKFYEDGFGVDRLGRRFKSCLECAERRKASAKKNKCPHGKRKTCCVECGGASICSHGKQKSRCVDCGGVGICEHEKIRSRCVLCGGGSICKHGKLRERCVECGGSQICEHERRKDKCNICKDPVKYCDHNAERSRCRRCTPIDRKDVITCECGDVITRGSLWRHCQTMEHKNLLEFGNRKGLFA